MTTTIAEKGGNLTVEVVEYSDKIVDADGNPAVREAAKFVVSRQVLVDSSQYFVKLLHSPSFKEAKQDSVTLEDDSIASMSIWFNILHGAKPDYDVKISEMWNLVAAGKKYWLDVSKLNAWFAAWYQKQPLDLWYATAKSNDDLRSLLYPCWVFDHPKGFLRVTRFMAYHCPGHLMEYNPTRHRDLHLPSGVIQQMNAAKGRLRTVLHRELFKPNETLLKAHCTCKEVTLFGYEKAMYVIDVWPLERVASKTSMSRILDRLDNFRFEPKKGACSSCKQDYQKTVAAAQGLTRNYFHGLCLDCMDKSNPKTGNEDLDYWRHNNLTEAQIVRGCRNVHGQPTWYFSFMGRREVRERYLKERRNRRYDGDSE